MENPPDFTDNKAWFNMKLYTDGSNDRKRIEKGLSNTRYADCIHGVFKTLKTASCHAAHLGRILGPKKLELLELSPEDIRILGNWDPKTQESCYSAKLPIASMKARAPSTLTRAQESRFLIA